MYCRAQIMVDFHACQWPASLPSAHDTSLAEYFDNLNEPGLSNLQARRRRAVGRPACPPLAALSDQTEAADQMEAALLVLLGQVYGVMVLWMSVCLVSAVLSHRPLWLSDAPRLIMGESAHVNLR